MSAQLSERMPRPRRRQAGRAALMLLGGVLLGATLTGAELLGTGLPGTTPTTAWAASECDRDWSITTLDGAPITSTAWFEDTTIAPGATLDGAFLVTTGSDIRGPLDLRAEPTGGSVDAALESELLVTLTGSSRSVTLPLSDLFADESARVIDALTPGAHSIGVSITLPFGSENATQITQLPFQLLVTVADTDSVVGGAPEPCTSVPGGGTSASGSPSGLASTGAQAGANVAWSAALLGAGFAAVLAARRRRRTSTDD